MEEAAAELDDPTTPVPKSAKTLPPAVVQDENDELAEVMQAVDASASRKLFEHILDTYYVPLELWYTRTIIDKVSVQTVKSYIC